MIEKTGMFLKRNVVYFAHFKEKQSYSVTKFDYFTYFCSVEIGQIFLFCILCGSFLFMHDSIIRKKIYSTAKFAVYSKFIMSKYAYARESVEK